MSLEKIKLTDYDNVVAVTQVAINQTMGEYLMAHPAAVALYAKDGTGGKVILLPDPKDASYIFTGTLAPEKVEGAWINIVELYLANMSNQTVQYNVTFKKAEFKALNFNMSWKQEGDTPWVFKFSVKLAMQEVAKSKLPDDLKRKLQNVDENMFSIQQLYMDLNTAAIASVQGTDMPGLVSSFMTAILKEHLAKQQEQNKPLFGVTVKFKDKTVSPPTLTPTYVNFCVTPYRDSTGKLNPKLDTLNYLVMTNHHEPPSYLPKSFDFNWVEDVTIHGTMAIKQEPFAKSLVGQLNPLLKTLCPKVHCVADIHGTPNQQEIHLEPGDDHVFTSTYDDSTGKIASSTYEHHHESFSKESGGLSYEQLQATYRMSCEVFLNKDKDTLKISGAIVVDAQHDTSDGQGGYTKRVMPKTTYQWSVELQVYMDPRNNGQLDFKVASEDFNKPPTVEQHDETAWQKFINTMGGQRFVNDIGDMRKHIKDQVTGSVVDSLQKALEKANHFIFPGAKTFTFKNPTFTDTRDLASNITYLNPNA